MFADSITFVAGKAILRVGGVEVHHESVAGDFGDDAGGGDAQAQGVAGDQGGVGYRESAHGESINEGVLGFLREGGNGADHGEVGGAEDVEGVDFLDGGCGDGPVDFRAGAEDGVDGFALFGGEFFRVVQAIEVEVMGQDDGGGHDGAGEGTASGFIDPGHQKKPAGAQGALAGKIAGH